MSVPLIHLDGVEFAYEQQTVLYEVALTVEAGDFLGIVGPSGSGKTTLLRLLTGQAAPSRGTVFRRPGLTVGYVPQLDAINWNFPLTVGECVAMSRPSRRLWPAPTRREREEVQEVLDRLGIADLRDRQIRALSGGQQQRMFLARALLRRPGVLLLDEPTSGIDIGTRHEMLHLLADLNGAGIAIVMTTHDLNGIAAHLPTVACLRHTVVAQGSPHLVLTPPVLERTFGARMEVLEHLGVPVVLDGAASRFPARRTA